MAKAMVDRDLWDDVVTVVMDATHFLDDQGYWSNEGELIHQALLDIAERIDNENI